MHEDVVVDHCREIIEALRMTHGLSVRALALKAGLNQPTLQRFLKGRSQTMEVENFQALARYFGVTMSELLGESPLGSTITARELGRVTAQMTPEQQEMLLRLARALLAPKPDA